MPLTLNFEAPNDGKIDCAGNRIIRCFACGGKPPYKWTTTAGTLDTNTGIMVKLSAPTNVKPSVAGNAYIFSTKFCTFGGFIDCACETYGCDGSVTIACSGIGCGTHLPSSCGSCVTNDPCVLFRDSSSTIENCPGLGEISTGCAGLPGHHFTEDIRTQDMIDEGCGPCEATMLNAVITVTDAQGTSVSRSITT